MGRLNLHNEAGQLKKTPGTAQSQLEHCNQAVQGLNL